MLPRSIETNYGIIESKIINVNIVSTISRWIDKMDVNNKFSHFRELYFPYKFKLLLRGSRDGFTPKKFHELCDNKPRTVTFMKVKETEEILGGYNPIIWKYSGHGEWGKTKDSFIFSFKLNVKNAIISSVKNANYAIFNNNKCGPYFGSDIIIQAKDESTDYDRIRCRNSYYEKRLRDTEDTSSIDDYEVFQVIEC